MVGVLVGGNGVLVDVGGTGVAVAVGGATAAVCVRLSEKIWAAWVRTAAEFSSALGPQAVRRSAISAMEKIVNRFKVMTSRLGNQPEIWTAIISSPIFG